MNELIKRLCPTLEISGGPGAVAFGMFLTFAMTVVGLSIAAFWITAAVRAAWSG